MTDIWSGQATLIERTKRTNLPVRTRPVQAIGIHTTGGGIIVKALKRGEEPFQVAAAYYARARSYASGYLVGAFAEDEYEADADDAIVGTVPDNLVAYHAGVSRGRIAIYRKGRDVWPRHLKRNKVWVDTGKIQPRYADWLARWPELDSPIDLFPGFASGVNSRTLSADLLAPEPGRRHADQQLRWMASLVGDLCERHGLAVTRQTVLRHADIDPLTRSSKRGGWDPPREAFERLAGFLDIGPAWPETGGIA